MKKFLNGVIGIFLLFNLTIRFGTIFNYPPYNGEIAGFLGAVVAACVYGVFRLGHLRHLLFIFGFSFFLFGFGSVDLQSRIFELIVTCVATALFVINWRAESGGQGAGSRGQGGRLNRPLVILILCYVGLSLFSLLLLPVTQIFRDLWFFGFPRFFFYFFIGPPYGFYYPAAAVIRLMLFVVLAIQISRTTRAQDNYKWLFSAIFSGAVFCAVIGLLDLYGLISLAPYRFGITAGVLQSTFLNRGWFAEFILTAVPFVLIGFMSRIKGLWWKILLFASLVICEITLILAGARAGWVSYPLILFICWLFFYFSKEGRIESFHFSWKDVVKVGISVPITIAISFFIVFQVLMPLSDSVTDSKEKGVQQKYRATAEYFENRVSGFTETGRIDTWKDSIQVGREGVWFGRGYEAYYWNAMVLEGIPSSPYMENRVHKDIRQTPHNTFIQLFVSGGIVGLSLWLVIIGYAITLLTLDLVKNKRLLNTPVIISIVAFHTYGIFQSMQYIPMIWSMIFLCLGYAMTIDDRVLPGRLRRMAGVLTKASVVLMVIGIFFYVSNFESRNLAQKYDMRVYAMEEDRDRFAGFHQHSQRWKYGDYRWSGKRGSILIAERGTRNAPRLNGPIYHLPELQGRLGGDPVQLGKEDAPVERPHVPSAGATGQAERGPGSTGQGTRNAEDILVELEFYCMTPGMEEEPVVVKVSHEGEVLDRIVFGGASREQGAGSREQGARGKGGSAKLKGKSSKAKGVSVRRRYELRGEQGAGSGEQRLDIEVSRTWVPHNHLGNFDRRELGIGVKILK